MRVSIPWTVRLEMKYKTIMWAPNVCFDALRMVLSLSEGSLGASYMQVPMLCGFVAFALMAYDSVDSFVSGIQYFDIRR